ncbi:MAG: hypothetical protein R6V03_06465 [Kiritimatiellia bacterium]
MKCSQTVKELLSGRERSKDVEDHLRRCRECRGISELTARLDRLGSGEAEEDLPAEKVEQLRRRAFGILAEPRSGAGDKLVFPFFSPQAAALAAVVLLAVGAMLWIYTPRDKSSGAGGTQSRVAAICGNLDTRIERKKESLDFALKSFREKHVEKTGPSGFERRARNIRSRIELCSLEIRGELEKAGVIAESRGS